MSDDISMGALTGTIAERTRAAFAAGCDLVLHCNGSLDEMQEVAAEAPLLGGRRRGARRCRACARAAPPVPSTSEAARGLRRAMMARPPEAARMAS